MATAKKNNIPQEPKRTKAKAESAGDMSAEDLAWDIFKKTGDINYYRFYSALKKEFGEDK